MFTKNNALVRAYGLDDKPFYQKTFRLFLPMFLQELTYTALYMADNVMIGSLGDISIAGVAAANQLTFLLDICLFGVMNGGTVFGSQYWGKRDIPGVRRTQGISLLFGISMGLLFTLVAGLCPAMLVDIFSDDPQVIAVGAGYLALVALGFVPRSIGSAYGATLKATNNAALPMATSLFSLVINIFLNWCLIFGKLGFPALGANGAAIATLVSNLLGVALLLTVTYAKKLPAASKLHELLSAKAKDIAAYLKVSLPIFASDLVWALGINAYNFLYGKMGTDAFAAVAIYSTVDKLAFVSMMALGLASGVVMGNTIGEGKRALAQPYAKRYLFIIGTFGVTAGLLVFFFGPSLVSLYRVSPGVAELARNMIRMLAFGITLFALNHCLIVGILRAGGDTKVALMLDTMPMWLIGIPLVWLVGVKLGYPLYIAYTCTFAADIVRVILGMRRVLGGRWINDLTVRS